MNFTTQLPLKYEDKKLYEFLVSGHLFLFILLKSEKVGFPIT